MNERRQCVWDCLFLSVSLTLTYSSFTSWLCGLSFSLLLFFNSPLASCHFSSLLWNRQVNEEEVEGLTEPLSSGFEFQVKNKLKLWCLGDCKVRHFTIAFYAGLTWTNTDRSVRGWRWEGRIEWALLLLPLPLPACDWVATWAATTASAATASSSSSSATSRLIPLITLLIRCSNIKLKINCLCSRGEERISISIELWWSLSDGRRRTPLASSALDRAALVGSGDGGDGGLEIVGEKRLPKGRPANLPLMNRLWSVKWAAAASAASVLSAGTDSSSSGGVIRANLSCNYGACLSAACLPSVCWTF